MPSIWPLMSERMSINGRISLFESSTLTRIAFNSSCTATVLSFDKMFLRSVPATLALMPELPSRPAAAETSSSDCPVKYANGATLDIVSPIIRMSVLALVAVAASTSATLASSSAGMCMAPPMSDAMSAASFSPTPPAAARDSVGPMPARICSVEKPA